VKTLFLIPARGGSKGFPGKNLALLAGIPLVGWAARLALRAAQYHPGSRVVCSTDDAAIADAAVTWGAEVPFIRPVELATDDASSIDVVRHALDHVEEDFGAVALLQPTSPLTAPKDVLAALELFSRSSSPVVAVAELDHPVEWCCRLGLDSRIEMIARETVARRQLAEGSFCPSGAIYVASPEQIRTRGFWTNDTRGLVMPRERSVDIDAPWDLAVAEAVLDARPVPAIEIGGRKIGPGHPCFIIAEAGVNHNGSLEMALQLVDAAAEAGADAVKFQLYRTDEQVTRNAGLAEYQKKTTHAATMAAMASDYEMPWCDHLVIRDHCQEVGIMYLASCFDQEAVDFYTSGIGGSALKVGSGEITNLPLLDYMATKRVPIILSCGMADMRDIERAVEVIGKSRDRLALLHCVSSYPAGHEDLNLRAMTSMRRAFATVVGYSDHAPGTIAATVALALGASIVEKHFTLDKSLPGPDHAMSLDPGELNQFVHSLRLAEQSLGETSKRVQASEVGVQLAARRSLVSREAIAAGEPLSMTHVTFKRPGTGISPVDWHKAIGRKAKTAIPEDSVITWGMLE